MVMSCVIVPLIASVAVSWMVGGATSASTTSAVLLTRNERIADTIWSRREGIRGGKARRRICLMGASFISSSSSSLAHRLEMYRKTEFKCVPQDLGAGDWWQGAVRVRSRRGRVPLNMWTGIVSKQDDEHGCE